MTTPRVIACLDVANGRVVKGVKFRDHVDVGDPVELAKRYVDQGIDELVFYDILASSKKEVFSPKLVEDIARSCSVPFCVAGGIKTLEDAQRCIWSGADKISINSAALARPDLVDEIASDLGSQATVVGIDTRDGEIFRLTGNEKTTQRTPWTIFEWIKEVETRGAGELVINSMDFDGTGSGANVELLSRIVESCSLPVVASGGIGSPEHVVNAFERTKVSAVLAAGMFHFKKATPGDVKEALKQANFEVRS